MELTEELRRMIASIEPGFFGSLEIGIQNGIAGHAKLTQTFKLSDRSRESRNDGNRNFNHR